MSKIKFEKTIIKYITSSATGKRLTEILSAKIPNTGGIIKMPKLQAVICELIMDCERSLPKCTGVICVRLGKVGPFPKPTKNKATPFTIAGSGANNKAIATPTVQ